MQRRAKTSGLVIGLLAGIVFGLITDRLALGIALGVIFGVAWQGICRARQESKTRYLPNFPPPKEPPGDDSSDVP